MTKAEAKRIARSDSLEDLRRWADEILSRARKASARHAPSRKAKEAKRQERNARMAEIRARVIERSRGRCELCGDPVHDAHHLMSGPLRRHRENEDTVIALCRPCHLRLHRGVLADLERAEWYCRSAGMHDAAAAIAKRIDKIDSLRMARAKRIA